MHTKLVLVIPALAGILLTAVLACNNADPEAVLARTQVELDKHRTLWEQTGSPDYTYEYRVGCLCALITWGTLKVTVTNGEAESAVYAGSGLPTDLEPQQIYKIDSLFHMIQRAITEEAERITVSYNSEFGYPTEIGIDYKANWTDTGYFVSANAYSPR